MITYSNPLNKDSEGNDLVPPYIDLPPGGNQNVWADDIPWYLNEVPEPGDPLQLEFFISETQLRYIDYPRRPPGGQVQLDTFLVADFGDLTYDVVAGFSWEILSRTNGTFDDLDGNGVWSDDEPFHVDEDSPVQDFAIAVSDVVSIEAGAQWQEVYENLIYSDFSYTRQSIQYDDSIEYPFSTIIINCPADPELVWVPRRKRVKVGGGGSSGGSGGGGSASGGRYKIVDDGYWKEVDSDCEEGHFSAVSDPGFYQQYPRLEDRTVDRWKEFFDVPSYKWFDPVTTYGLEFQALENTLFTDIFNFPTGMDANDLFTVVVDGTVIGKYRPG